MLTVCVVVNINVLCGWVCVCVRVWVCVYTCACEAGVVEVCNIHIQYICVCM